LPLSLLISILSLQGFDLNNLTTIPKYFYFLVVLMFGITFISLFIFWKKRWIFSNEKTLIDNKDSDKKKDHNNK
jgi:magnesium transporter